MVLMHRRDIIERYGFDPGENSSVVPKGDPTAAVNTVPDAEKIEAPSQETTSSGVLPNLGAGAIKSFVSDPLMLAGLATGVAYYAKRHLLDGDKDAAFAEGLYQEGGLEAVKQHLEDKQRQIQAEHPDWNPEAVNQELQVYQASPDFFRFNTDKMSGPVRIALQNAYKVNQLTGVNKTPSQETFTDDTLQTLGGLLTPTGFLKVATIGEKLAGKVGKIAGHLLDYTVIPGTHSYRPTALAGNVAGGMAIDELQRHVTGDPTLLPGGAALNEYVKQSEQFDGSGPITPEPIPTGFIPSQHLSEGEIPLAAPPGTGTSTAIPPDVDPSTIAPTQAGIGTAATIGAGVLGAGLLARSAFRGRVAMPIAPPRVDIASDIAANRVAAGVGAPFDPNILHRGTEYIDQKLDINAPILQQARELGVEAPVQAELGGQLTSHGQQLSLKNVWENGILPDNSTTTPVKQNFDIHAAADPQVQQLADEAIHATNVLNTIDKSRIQATAEHNIAQRALMKNPLDPELVNRAYEANQTRLLWDTYDPKIRRYLPDTDEAELQRRVSAAVSDPQANALINNHAEIMDTVDRTLLAGEIINKPEYERRRIEDPNHTALFEYDPTGKAKYDPTEKRTTELRPSVRVRDPLPPMAAARLSLEIASRAAAHETGLRNAIRTLQAADPTGEFVRVHPPGTKANTQFGKTVQFYEGGERYVAQLARDHVADALKQSPVDGGMAWNLVNSLRLAAQIAYIGLVKGPIQAPITFFYNAVTAYAAQRAGTSFGYISRAIRDIAPNSWIAGKAADIVDAIDIPSRLLVYGVAGAEGAALKASAAFGAKLMTQAITQGGLFGHLANTIPNGHAILAGIGARMKAYHDSSWMMHWNRWGEAGTHPGIFDKDIFANRYMKDIQAYAQGTPHGALYQWGGLRPLFNGYMSILNHIATLHQMAEASRSYHALEIELGRPPTLSETHVAMEHARISAGDMSARPGGAALRWTGGLFPFVRIGIASARYLFHALTSRGAWDSSMVAARVGAVAAAMYASQKEIEGLGFGDWFYEQLNDFERLGKYWMLKPKHRIDILLGRKPQLDMEDPKNNFYEVPIPQEMNAFYGTMMYGLEQLGLLNRGSNRGNTSAEKDLLWNVLSTIGISSSPAINAITIPILGQKFDASALFRGKDPLTPIQESRGQLGTLPSGIPSRLAETLKALFGFNADLAISSLDAGLQSYNKTHDAVSTTHRAWDEASGIVRGNIPSVPGLWDAEKKHYNFDAMSLENARIRKVAQSLETAYQNTFTSAGISRGENRRAVVDEEVAEMLATTHSFFMKGGLKSVQKQINNLYNQLDNLKASKGEKSYNEIKTEESGIIKELKVWYEEQSSVIRDYEDYIRDSYGERLKKEGLEPNIDSVAKLVKKYSG